MVSDPERDRTAVDRLSLQGEIKLPYENQPLCSPFSFGGDKGSLNPHPYLNEIVLCTMKSEQGSDEVLGFASDEVFSLRLQIK